MLNFFYVDYPYGNAEVFVEYEMRALAEYGDKDVIIYTLNNQNGGEKRFVPSNAKVISVHDENTAYIYVKAAISMFSLESLKEIANLFKEKHCEGFLRCVWRIYRYQLDAAKIISHYKKMHTKGEKDVLVSYWINQCAFALVKLKKMYPEIKIVSRGHGFDVLKERCYLPFRRFILAGLDRVYLINHRNKQYFEDNYGGWLDTSKIEIEHLGVTVPETVAVVDEKDAFRVVTCSSVIPLKRLDLMIDALSLIKDKNIEWVHFGGGPLFDKMKAYAEEKLKNTSIKYVFMGQKSSSDIQRYYATTSINLFVNCSDTEGTPVSVMEAMSYGIPAIARNVGGNGEAVSDDCGMLIPSAASAELLESAIENFYDMDKDSYFAKRQAARQKIEREFNAGVTYKEYIEKISRLTHEEI